MAWRSICFALAALSLGCGGGCSGPEAASAGARTAGQPSPSGTEDPRPRAPPDPMPVLQILGDVEGREVTPRVENHGDADAHLSTVVAIERANGSAFASIDNLQVKLRMDCSTEPPACVSLAPGGTFLPPPWLGTIGDAQCECTRCAPANGGRYRFVVTTCDGGHRVEGQPFELPQ